LLRSVRFDHHEDAFKCPRNNSFLLIISQNTDHCMSFTSSCLTIRKDSPVISFKNRVDDWIGRFIKNVLLKCCITINTIESESFRAFFSWLKHQNFSSFSINLDCLLSAFIHFFCSHRSASDDHSDTFTLLFNLNFHLSCHLI